MFLFSNLNYYPNCDSYLFYVCYCSNLNALLGVLHEEKLLIESYDFTTDGVWGVLSVSFVFILTYFSARSTEILFYLSRLLSLVISYLTNGDFLSCMFSSIYYLKAEIILSYEGSRFSGLSSANFTSLFFFKAEIGFWSILIFV